MPIYATSTYKQDGVGGLRGGYEYSRVGQPDPDGAGGVPGRPRGRRAAAWRSRPGWPPRTACCARVLPPGGPRTCIPNDAYGGTFRLFARVLARWGVEFTPVAAGRPRRGARGRSGTHDPGAVVRDADQPAARHRRHRRRSPASRTRPARCSSSTTRSPRRTCSSRWRSAPTSWCTRTTKYLGGHSRRRRRRAGASATPSSGSELRLPPERDRRGRRSVRRLAGAARDQDAGGAHGSALRQRRAGRRPAGRASGGGRRCSIPGLPDAPGPRGRRASRCATSAGWCRSGCARRRAGRAARSAGGRRCSPSASRSAGSSR